MSLLKWIKELLTHTESNRKTKIHTYSSNSNVNRSAYTNGQNNSYNTIDNNTYRKKKLLSPCEKRYYTTFLKALDNEYLVFPQINLASIVEKTNISKYRNELFRNIDFVVFDYNLEPILLIEINDSTHYEQSRVERDEKVRIIAEKAKIPLIVFWIEREFNENLIIQRIRNTINKQ